MQAVVVREEARVKEREEGGAVQEEARVKEREEAGR